MSFGKLCNKELKVKKNEFVGRIGLLNLCVSLNYREVRTGFRESVTQIARKILRKKISS